MMTFHIIFHNLPRLSPVKYLKMFQQIHSSGNYVAVDQCPSPKHCWLVHSASIVATKHMNLSAVTFVFIFLLIYSSSSIAFTPSPSFRPSSFSVSVENYCKSAGTGKALNHIPVSCCAFQFFRGFVFLSVNDNKLHKHMLVWF